MMETIAGLLFLFFFWAILHFIVHIMIPGGIILAKILAVVIGISICVILGLGSMAYLIFY